MGLEADLRAAALAGRLRSFQIVQTSDGRWQANMRTVDAYSHAVFDDVVDALRDALYLDRPADAPQPVGKARTLAAFTQDELDLLG